MKTSNLILTALFCFIFGLFQSCQSEDENILMTADTPSLKELEVGQKISYRKIKVDFKSDTTNNSLEKTCYYDNDILILEVIEKSANEVVIKEYLSTQNPDDVGKTVLTFKDDIVEVMQVGTITEHAPSLFHQKTFSLSPGGLPPGNIEEDCFYNIPPTNQPVEDNNEFKITNATINGVTYNNLYAYRFENAMVFDGPGYDYLLDENGAMIRSTTYGSFFPYLEGWEIILE